MKPADRPTKPASAQAETSQEPWHALLSHWRRLGPPLFPVDEDLQRLRATWLASVGGKIPAPRVDILLLGVTSQYAEFPWAPAAQLTALDTSEAMIRAVWPGDMPNRRAVRGDWLNMPFEPASFDLVLCDNGPTLFNAADLRRWSREIRRVLRPNGRAVMRNFAPPPHPETIASLVAAVEAGRITNFHSFKMRWLMALEAESAVPGVSLAAGWEQFTRHFPDRAAFTARTGISAETISTLDAYRDSKGWYYFHSTPDLAAGFADFTLQPGPAGSYEFAACCPVFSLTPRP